MENTESIFKRLYDHLQKENDWVSRAVLIRSISTGQEKADNIREAFVFLEKAVNIGKIYRDGTTCYRWYDIAEEFKEAIKADLEWFDNLPSSPQRSHPTDDKKFDIPEKKGDSQGELWLQENSSGAAPKRKKSLAHILSSSRAIFMVLRQCAKSFSKKSFYREKIFIMLMKKHSLYILFKIYKKMEQCGFTLILLDECCAKQKKRVWRIGANDGKTLILQGMLRQ